MTSLPPVVWIAVVGAALLLLGLCGATAYGVLRASARSRIARWPAARILILLVAAAVPWLVVRLAPIRVSADIHGIVPLIGWLLVALARRVPRTVGEIRPRTAPGFIADCHT